MGPRSVLTPSSCTLLTLLLLPSLGSAQARSSFVYGRLIDDATRGPIAAGAVSLVIKDGTRVATAITDSIGQFRIIVKEPGEYRLSAERIGYKTGHSESFALGTGEALAMDFWLSTNAVLLAPIEVKVTARQWLDRNKSAGMAPFYERMQWYGKLGGVFLTRDQVREWDGNMVTSMLIATAGAQSDGRGAIALRLGCTPTYYLNGAPFRLDPNETIDQLFRPSDLEAVEVYKGASTLPGELGGTQGSCAVVLWTRRSN
jgi:carboxypeptidase family protein